MKSGSSLLLTALVAAVVGGGSAAFAVALLAPVETARPAQAADPIQGNRGSIELELARLQSESDELFLRLAKLETEFALTAARVPLEPFGSQGAGVSANDLEPNPSDPEFMASVSAAVADLRKQTQEESKARFQEIQSQKISGRLNRFAERANLSVYQIEEMLTVLLDREVQLLEINDLGKELGSKEQVRLSLRELRIQTDERLATILTPDQLQQYQEFEGSRDDRRFGSPDRGPNDPKRGRDGDN